MACNPMFCLLYAQQSRQLGDEHEKIDKKEDDYEGTNEDEDRDDDAAAADDGGGVVVEF